MKNIIKKFISDFKDFIEESSFITVSISFLVATAIKDLSTAFFTYIITPILDKLLTLMGLKSASGTVNILGINFGIAPFISAIFSFIFILLIAFFVLKSYNIFLKKQIDLNAITNGNSSSKNNEDEISILKEIRDELQTINKKEQNGNNICDD